MSNLRYLKKETMGSAVASFSITDIFSTDYDVYYINIPTLHMANQVSLRMRFINATGSVLTSDYNLAQRIYYSHAGFAESKLTNQSYLQLGYYDTDALASGMGVSMYIYNPTVTGNNTYIQSQANFYEQLAGAGDGTKTIGNIENTGSITGLNFINHTGANFNAFEVVAYGIRVDE